MPEFFTGHVKIRTIVLFFMGSKIKHSLRTILMPEPTKENLSKDATVVAAAAAAAAVKMCIHWSGRGSALSRYHSQSLPCNIRGECFSTKQLVHMDKSPGTLPDFPYASSLGNWPLTFNLDN